jgi:ABC-2 type transport system ATP-binding protein
MANVHDSPEVIVSLEQAAARGGARATPLAVRLGPGLHALVGTPADGTEEIAPLVGGVVPAATGRVRVAGRDPSRTPALRARIGVMLATPLLPHCHTVADLLSLVAQVRGTRGADALSELGLSHWRARTLASLSPCDRRALELVLAVSVPEPLAIVLTEPGAGVSSIDRDALGRVLVRAAASGASVIVTTASVNDAVELAQTVHMLEKGRIVRSVPVSEKGGLVPGMGIELCVEIDLARAFVAELTSDPAVSGVDWNEAARPSVVLVRGADVDQVALAVARAAAMTGGHVRSIAPIAPGLDEVRAASAGLALAAYHAAYAAYAAYATPWVDAAQKAATARRG